MRVSLRAITMEEPSARQSSAPPQGRTRSPARSGIIAALGAWRSLVARTVRVGEVPGSNPGAPMKTISSGLFVIMHGMADSAAEKMGLQATSARQKL